MKCTSGSGQCEKINIVLSSGSVHVSYTMPHVSTSKTGSQIAALTTATTDGSLAQNVLDAIGTIPNIDTVELGTPAVTNVLPPHVVEVEEEEVVTTAAPTQAPTPPPPTTTQLMTNLNEEASPDRMQSTGFLIAAVACVV